MPEDQSGKQFSYHPGHHFINGHDIEMIAKECEANDHIAKPIDVEHLVEKVAGLLDHRSLAY